MRRLSPFKLPTVLVLLLTFLPIRTGFSQSQGSELAIIDQDLPALETLIRGLKKDIKIVYFDKSKGILNSINESLEMNSPVKTLHIFTHGMQGSFFTTYDMVDINALIAERSTISGWKNYFHGNGDILLYGCDIGNGITGLSFCQKFSELSGLNIAASANATGTSLKGGDWNLEIKVGNVDSESFLSNIEYPFLLAPATQILVYGGPTLSSYAQSVATYYTGKGRSVTFITGASTLPDLGDYALVCLIEPERAFSATEIAYLSAHLNKGGRIILTGEHSGFATQNACVTNTVLALGGHLSIQNLMLDGSSTYLPNINMNMSSDLMEGVNKLWGSAASAVNIGGDAVVINRSVTDNTKIVMAQERLGNGDIVAWADVNFWDKINDATWGTAKFFDNLADKAILNIQSKAIAELTTIEAYSVAGISAFSGGNITDDKGSAITERGVCWSETSFSPSISDHKIVGPGIGTGLYNVQINGLTMNTKYYVRAYAINGIGTAYGNTVSFTTSATTNTAPTAVADNFSCQKSGTISGNVKNNDFDSDGDPTTAHIVVTPSYTTGVFTLNTDGSFTYTHNGNSAAADFFSYYLTDNNGGTSATVGVSIALFTPSNPPTGADGSVNVTAGQVFSFSPSDFTFSDADAGHIFNGIKLVTAPLKGLLKYNGFAVSDGSIYNNITKLTFDNNGQSGGSPFTSFSFKVVASSGEESSSPYTMSIQLAGGKTDQSISFDALPGKTYGDPDFEPNATASSGLTVSYASNNPAVANIVSGNIHIVGAGIAIITASQAGNETYSAAPDVTQNLTVDKATQTIDFSAIPAKVYGNTDFVPGATATSGLTVTYNSDNTAVATIVSGNIHILGAGSAIITASQGGNSNYNSAVEVIQALTVGKADQTIDFSVLPGKTYGNSDFEPEAFASSGLTIGYESSNTSVATVSDGKIHIVGAGAAEIKASQKGNDNYNAAPDELQTLNVGKAELTVKAKDKSKIYGDTNPPLTINYVGFVNEDDASVLDNPVNISTPADQNCNSGNYTIAVSGGMDDNYSLNLLEGVLTVNKAELTVTAVEQIKVYGDPNPSFTLNYSGFKNNENSDVIDNEPAVTSSVMTKSDVGNYLLTVSGGSDNNYFFTYNSGTIIVNKKELTVIADNQQKIYGEINPDLTISYNGFLEDEDASVLDILPVCSTIDNESSDAGNYTISPSGAADNNYSFIYNEGTLLINKRNLEVTASNTEKTYGDANPTFSLQYTGFVNGDGTDVLDIPPVVNSEAGQDSDAGVYSINGKDGSDNNYAFIYIGGSLTVNKREIKVIPVDQVKTYGEVLPILTVGYEGMVNQDDASEIDLPPVISTTADVFSPKGEYPISASDAEDNNYTFIYYKGNLTVNPRDLLITAVNKSIAYGQTLPELTWVTEGFAGNDNESIFSSPVEIQTTANEESDAGIYPITVSGAVADDYYRIIFVEGTMEINKAPLTVTPDNKEKHYGEQNPSLTLTYTGFVNNEDQTMLDIAPMVITDASQLTPTGEYSIVPQNGEDHNYSFIYQNATLTIIKADQAIEFEAIPADLRASASHTLVAKATSNLPVTYVCSDPLAASIDGDQLIINREGTIRITAFQTGDNNWNSAETSQTIETKPSFDNSDYLMTPNSDGINDYWHVNYLEDYGKAKVLIYNRWGKKVFESSDYANDWDGIYNGSLLPSGSYYFIIDSENEGVKKGVINIVY